MKIKETTPDVERTFTLKLTEDELNRLGYYAACSRMAAEPGTVLDADELAGTIGDALGYRPEIPGDLNRMETAPRPTLSNLINDALYGTYTFGRPFTHTFNPSNA